MSDKESTDADQLRQAKLLAARKKLKKFQSKKLDQHSQADTESCSSKTSQETKPGDAVLFSSHGLAKRSDGVVSPKTMPIVRPFASPPPRASPSAIMSSSPPPPPSGFSVDLVSSPTFQETPLSTPGTRAPPLPHHEHPQPTSPPAAPQQSIPLLQHKMDALEQERAALVTQSEQLRQQLADLHRQCNELTDEKTHAAQQYDVLTETHRLLEQRYGEVKQQLLASNTNLETQQEKVTELQAALTSAEGQLQSDSQLSALVATQKKALAEMTASNEDFHTETTRLIDMVNDLEEELARTQADNYTKDCEIKSINTQLYDLARGNHGSLVADLEKKTLERDSLRQTLQADQRRLAALGPELDTLKTRLASANQERTSLERQLEEKDEAIRQLQSTLDDTTQLDALQSEYEAIKQAADQWQQQTIELQQQLDAKTKDHDGYETEISELKQQLRDAETSSKTKDEELEHMKGSIHQLESQHDLMKQQLGDTTQLVEANERTIDQLRDYIKKLQQIHISLTRDLTAAQEAQASFDKTLEASSADLDNLQQQYTALQQTLGEKEALYNTLLEAKDNLARQLEQSQSTHRQHQHVMTERVDRINQKMAHILSTYEKMERTTVEVEAKVLAAVQPKSDNETTGQADDLAALRQTLAMTESQAKAHLDKLTALEARSLEQKLYIDKLETDKQSFDEQRRFLEQQLAGLQEDLDEKRELADMFEDARTSLINEQNSLTSRLQEQQALTTSLNTQIQDGNHEIGQLQEKIKSLESTGHGEWERKYQDLELQLKDQMATQQKLIGEKESQEASLNDIKKTMEQLQAHADSLEQQLSSERATSAAANNELRQQLLALDNNIPAGDNDRLLQQERDQRQNQVELLENQLTTLQEELTELQDKAEEQKRLYNDKHQQWMTEQNKVTTMTEDISQLQEKLQQHLTEQQALQHQLDDQQNKEENVAQLTNELKEAQGQVEQLQARVASQDSGSERELALEAEVKELRSRLERQFDAFTTIRGELTTVRDRQFNAEREATREKNDLMRQRQGLEQTIERLRNEYQEHLERMWEQHEAIRQHHEEDLTVGRDALDSAQVKLMQNGLSPVSENGFEWVNSDSEQEEGDDGNTADGNSNRTPSVGRLPPLRKPDFFEFLETPRCNGCQSEVIDI